MPWSEGDTDVLTLVSKVGKGCSALLQNMKLSDILLLIGAGGLITYLWTYYEPGSPCEARFKKTDLISWLLEKPVLQNNKELVHILLNDSKLEKEFLQNNTHASHSLQVNALLSSKKSETLVEQKLFNIGNTKLKSGLIKQEQCLTTEENSFLGEVSSYNSEQLRVSNCKYRSLPGYPVSEERSAELEKNPRVFPVSRSMREMMMSAREVRRLIRDTDLDSQASDLWLDLPTREGSSVGEDLEKYTEVKEESLTLLKKPSISFTDLLRLVEFSDRESSLYSDCSEDWKDEKLCKVAFHTSESSDQWEWEDECSHDDSEQQSNPDVWMPENSELTWRRNED